MEGWKAEGVRLEILNISTLQHVTIKNKKKVEGWKAEGGKVKHSEHFNLTTFNL